MGIHEVLWLKLLKIEKEGYERYESLNGEGWTSTKVAIEILRKCTNATKSFLASIQNKDIPLFKVKKFWSTVLDMVESKSLIHEMMSEIALTDTSAAFTLSFKTNLYNLC